MLKCKSKIFWPRLLAFDAVCGIRKIKKKNSQEIEKLLRLSLCFMKGFIKLRKSNFRKIIAHL